MQIVILLRVKYLKATDLLTPSTPLFLSCSSSPSFLLLKYSRRKKVLSFNKVSDEMVTHFYSHAVRCNSSHLIQPIPLTFNLQWQIQPQKFSHCKTNLSRQHLIDQQLQPQVNQDNDSLTDWSEMRIPLIITTSIYILLYLLRIQKASQYIIILKRLKNIKIYADILTKY